MAAFCASNPVIVSPRIRSTKFRTIRATISDRISNKTETSAARLRRVLGSGKLSLMPCCYDGLSARLIERAGFDLTFMSGYSVAGSFGLPDTGLLTATELADALRRITAATNLPVIADADTGFGNSINVKRTLATYFKSGAAGVLIEDQVNPKRCGHTRGKAVVSFSDALIRCRAACDARDEWTDEVNDRPVVLARTDAARFDFEEALKRARAFLDIGADGTFIEAPQNIDQMKRYCEEIPGWKLVNCLEGGQTPILSPDQLETLGFTIAAYPLTLISAGIKAQEEALRKLKNGQPSDEVIKSFGELCDIVGFNDYYEQLEGYELGEVNK